MSSDSGGKLDKLRVRRAFDSAAETYDEHAELQRLVVDRLLENLDAVRIEPHTILDIGAGTGYCSRALARRYRGARTLLLDLAPSMLAFARSKTKRWRSSHSYICADAEALPVTDAAVDFVFSSLTFQWCEDLDRLFAECRRVLKQPGLLLFSSLGPDTLQELRYAWAGVDPSPRVNPFIDMHDVGDALIRAGFDAPVLETELITVNYDDVRGVMRDLRGTGAVNSLRGRRRGLSTPAAWRRMVERYEGLRRNDKLPATFEVVYAHAWCPEPGRATGDPKNTVATFPAANVRRRR